MLNLQQVELRLSRAGKHLAELESLARSRESTTRKSITVYSNDWDDLTEIYISGNSIEVLGETEVREFSVVIDDIAHNLRAALNYLIVALARFDSMKQKIHSSLQFPIERSEDKFWEHRPNYLRGLSSEHIAIIERVQPYKGCHWTKFVQSLSNKGKHLELVRLIHTTGALTADETNALVDSVASSVLDDVANSVEELWYPDSVTTDVEASTRIAFADGHPVVDKLHELETQVSTFIEQFKSS